MPQNIRSAIMDPLLTFKYLVSWTDDGGSFSVVAGVSKIGPLTRSTESAPYREGAAPTMTRQIPGQTKYSEVKLERGIILDVAFEQWVNKVWYYNNSGALGSNVSLKDFRKDLKIELCNQAGQIMNTYYVYNCWPSEYTALPELDASAGRRPVPKPCGQGRGRPPRFAPSHSPQPHRLPKSARGPGTPGTEAPSRRVRCRRRAVGTLPS